MNYECSKEDFLQDVYEHRLIIKKDDPDYKHLQFIDEKRRFPFNIITWPGHLCITGDMGTFVFSRNFDMISFFRMDSLEIKPGYWTSKLLTNKDDALEFDPELFKQALLEWIEEYPDEEIIKEEIENELFPYADDGIDVAIYNAIYYHYNGSHIKTCKTLDEAYSEINKNFGILNGTLNISTNNVFRRN